MPGRQPTLSGNDSLGETVLLVSGSRFFLRGVSVRRRPTRRRKGCFLFDLTETGVTGRGGVTTRFDAKVGVMKCGD